MTACRARLDRYDDAAPAPRRLNRDQERFLLLHKHQLVLEWRWLFGEASLRAAAAGDVAATISRRDLLALVGAGLCRLRGVAQVTLTRAGWRAVG